MRNLFFQQNKADFIMLFSCIFVAALSIRVSMFRRHAYVLQLPHHGPYRRRSVSVRPAADYIAVYQPAQVKVLMPAVCLFFPALPPATWPAVCLTVRPAPLARQMSLPLRLRER